MNRIKIAADLLKMARSLVAFGGKHVDVSDLPEGLQRALKSIGFRKRNVEVVKATSFESNTAFEGNRAHAYTVNISSGRITDSQTGSWGGGNMFEDRPIDRPDSIKIPSGSVVIGGESGGRGTFYRIYVNNADLDSVMLNDESDAVSLTDDEANALDVIASMKSSGRASEFVWRKLGDYSKDNPLIRSLADKGMIKVMGSGIRITTLGRNARGPRGRYGSTRSLVAVRVPSKAKRLVDKAMAKAIKKDEFYGDPDYDAVWEKIYDTLASEYLDYDYDDSDEEINDTEEVREWTNELVDSWSKKIEEEYEIKELPVRRDAKSLISEDLKSFLDAVSDFAFDSYHDEDQGNYSDANDLMSDIKRERTIKGVVKGMKSWGVKPREFREFVKEYASEFGKPELMSYYR